MQGVLEYQGGGTVLHRAHPLVKLALAAVVCVGGFVTRSLLVNLALLALSICGGFALGLGGKVKSSLKGAGSLCLFLFVVQLPFVRAGRTLVPLPFGLGITDEGLRFCARFAARLLGATLPLVLMLGVTRLSDLTNTLVAQLGIPYRYAFVVTTAIRFIPVLFVEMRDVIEAQTARGVELDGSFTRKIKLIPPLCVPLLVSCAQRMENNALAAELRGFYLRKRGSGYRRYPLTGSDALLLAVCGLVAAAAIIT
ncbi:MAG: energy-coupling factor transporter transmembrane protein EcfT [Oscillospiraceae bacterium]|jgi:energy-coupling factor transport system permease protein|nr:energy-coupling factor transporter transmembrane protein EcfT [Oscillospiraceae bacterium]